MKEIGSHTELLQEIKGLEAAYLLIYKKGSEQSDCAFENLSLALADNSEIKAFVADTNVVRDIHPKYDITSAPTLVIFEEGNFKNTVKGCHHPGFFNSIFDNAFVAASADTDKPSKRVTVYSTPSCSWCTTLKTYLRKNGIRYTDVDVSRDQARAEEIFTGFFMTGFPYMESLSFQLRRCGHI